MNLKDKKLAILGSTGSVGRQALDVALHHGLQVISLAAGQDIHMLEDQIRCFKPSICAVANERAAAALKISVADTPTKIISGREGVLEAAAFSDCDTVVNAVSGFHGLAPTLAAIDAGKQIALANKETIVAAGDIVMDRARKAGVSLLPVDSEHCAIFQCLTEHRVRAGKFPHSIRGSGTGTSTVSESSEFSASSIPSDIPAGAPDISRLLLTASGGPFFGFTPDELRNVTPEKALCHPTWRMGPKITIDCASMANKGLEIIEASHLFGIDASRIEVVIHRESIIHSMVEYIDNAVIAQLSVPDMRLCIQYALSYPDRCPGKTQRLDLPSLSRLTFYKPDTTTFTLLNTAYFALQEGGLLPAVFNASNEAAVERFLNGTLSFTGIFDAVDRVTREFKNQSQPSLEDIEEADREARRMVGELRLLR